MRLCERLTYSDQVEKNVAGRGVVAAVHEARLGHASEAALTKRGRSATYSRCERNSKS